MLVTWVRSIKSICSHNMNWRSILYLPFHLHQRLPSNLFTFIFILASTLTSSSDLFVSDFHTNPCIVSPLSHNPTSFAPLIPFDFNSRIKFRYQYRLQIPHFEIPPFTCYIWTLTPFSSTLIWSSLTLYLSVKNETKFQVLSQQWAKLFLLVFQWTYLLISNW